jgi:hypothetical protein
VSPLGADDRPPMGPPRTVWLGEANMPPPPEKRSTSYLFSRMEGRQPAHRGLHLFPPHARDTHTQGVGRRTGSSRVEDSARCWQRLGGFAINGQPVAGRSDARAQPRQSPAYAGIRHWLHKRILHWRPMARGVSYGYPRNTHTRRLRPIWGQGRGQGPFGDLRRSRPGDVFHLFHSGGGKPWQ